MQGDTFLTAYVLIVSGIFGAVFGSFMNCMAWRIAHGESVAKGRSHCAVCGHDLGAMDLIPVFSWLFLKGKCRYCGEKISPRYMAAEIIMAATFVMSAGQFGLTAKTIIAMAFACVLMALSLVDVEIYEIPDRFILAGICIWIVSLMFAAEPLIEVKNGLAAGFALGGGMLALSLVFDKVLGKESLGGGDIKLFFMTGLYLGPWAGLFNLILACIFGIATAVLLKEKKIPFGPAISLASFISFLYGGGFVEWYLGLFLL